MELPKDAHCAIICGKTNCGKTKFALDLIENYYRDVFEHIVILCPTIRDNETYKSRRWIENDPEVYAILPGDRINDCLKHFHEKFKNETTLFIIDDCSAERELSLKRQELSRLAFSGRHTSHSVWILSQKYNSILTDFREQTRWVAMFKCKDKDNFDECLRENYVIKTKAEKEEVRKMLDENRYSKLILCTDYPSFYKVIV